MKTWWHKNLTVESKIIIFKALALSNFVLLAPVLPISNDIIQRIQSEFLWNSNNVKIKHKAICYDFQNGVLKNLDISWKMSRVKNLYDQNFQD